MPHRERVVLSPVQIEEALTDLDGWELKGGKIERSFKTGSFLNGLELVQEIAKVAEEMKHHPDVMLTYPKVKILLMTHDVNGITQLDVKLAAAINKIADQQGVS